MEKLLDTTELAEVLGIPVKTLQDWRLRGLGPDYLRCGRHVRYEPSAVRIWQDAQTVRPRNAAA